MHCVRSSKAGRRSAAMWQGAWIRVSEGDHGITCEVMGLGHRFRQDRMVSVEAARRLAARGVPLVVRRAPGHGVR